MRIGAATGRGVRIWAVSSFVFLTVFGAAAALWLFAGRTDRQERVTPRPAISELERPAPAEPIRLDKLPPRLSDRPKKSRTSANAVPVIGVGTEEFAGEPETGEPPRGDATVDVDGAGPVEEAPSDAEIKSQLAALERANERVEAALAGAQGPASGTGELIWPVRGAVTSPFGPRWGRLHAGIDINASTGTPVRAADGGRVALSGVVSGYGNYICIQHTRSLSSCYAHNSSNGVRKGESVRKGQVISRSGCTGRCFGPHLHFEVRVGGRPVDPMRYL